MLRRNIETSQDKRPCDICGLKFTRRELSYEFKKFVCLKCRLDIVSEVAIESTLSKIQKKEQQEKQLNDVRVKQIYKKGSLDMLNTLYKTNIISYSTYEYLGRSYK